MKYCMCIEQRHCDPIYVRGLESWKDVTDYLKNKLETRAWGVNIVKYSSDGKLLGRIFVTMKNFIKVATSTTDKVLKRRNEV